MRLVAAAVLAAAGLAGARSSPAPAQQPAQGHAPAQLPTSDAGAVVNSVGMRLVLVPAGTFTMGTPLGEPLRQEEETTRQVTLTKPFRVSATEVTRKQWAAVMGGAADSSVTGAAGPADATGTPVVADLPVTSVSWNDAQAFCQKLSAKEGVRYRLPTEAVWEYACRAGAGTAVDRDATAWHAGNSDGEAHAVARKQPNPWGLFDVLGNAAEWTQDSYAPYPRADETDPAGPAAGGQKVVRGGSFRSFVPALRCAARVGTPGSYQLPHVGFRVVQEVR